MIFAFTAARRHVVGAAGRTWQRALDGDEMALVISCRASYLIMAAAAYLTGAGAHAS